MCAPEIIEHVTALAPPSEAPVGSPGPGPLEPQTSPARRCFTHAVDLSHPLSADFPTYSGEVWLELEEFRNFTVHGVNFKRWHVHEHVGTHIDAPIHFSRDGKTADEIPLESLVLPLAVIDIRARAADDPDTELTPEDISVWEARHGELPEACCVAVDAGWDRHASGPRFRNVDEHGVLHFPGVHVDAAQMLLEERNVIGLGVDTMSIDHGPSTAFPTHRKWLPAGRWAVENLANLSRLPPIGATMVVGAPTIVGATGGPSRILALV